jgi:hypothetical protein
MELRAAATHRPVEVGVVVGHTQEHIISDFWHRKMFQFKLALQLLRRAKPGFLVQRL